MDSQTRQAIDTLVQQIADLQDKVARTERAAGTPQLVNSSITGGGLKAIDETGMHRGTIGFQGDGTFGTVAKNGPPPPAPSVPAVTAGQLSLTVTWDGLFATDDDGDPTTMPLDFDHVEVHLSTTSGFVPGAGTRYGTLAKAGAIVCSPLVDGTTYYAVLVAVTTSKVAGDASAAATGVPEAVVATDVLDGIITTVKLADDAVTEAKIAAAAVGTTEIADDAVTTPKVVAGAIQTAQIAAGAVDAGTIAAGAVTTAALDALAVTSDKIAANAITAGKLDAGAVTAGSIAAGAIDGKTITGATIITDSATGGVFIYSGTPALGNLIVSAAAAGGMDGFGNTYPQGLVVLAGEIDAALINGSTITAGSISAGSIGNSVLVSNDFQGGTMENTDVVFDDETGRILVYAQTTSTVVLSSGTFTVPAGVTTLAVECWGAGAGGTGGDSSGGSFSGGPGGGGGAYAKVSSLAVTPGDTFTVTVGAGGSGGGPNTLGGTGGPSSFGTVCVAAGGDSDFLPNGGKGGSAADSVGDVKFSGGNAGTASGSGASGGGSSAGTASNGNPSANNTGTGSGAGGPATAGGGAGGTGGAVHTNGTAGTAPGGGGGGGGGGTGTTGTGGNGGAGKVAVTYLAGARVLIASIAAEAGTDADGTAYPAGIGGASPVFTGTAQFDDMTATNPSTGAAETWHNASYGSGWSDGAAPAVGVQYRKIPGNKVEFKGSALNNSAAVGQTMFTLPLGYRPPVLRTMLCYCRSTLSAGAVNFNTNGTVTLLSQPTNGHTFEFDGMYISLDA